MSVKNNEPLIAFTTLERGMTRDEMKQRLIQAMLNKGIAVKGYDISVNPNTADGIKKKGGR